ncbi:MAG: hypothetical protein WC675_03035 [Patescibacteria group bacterium]|jgi:Tfp pilus assembly major pilin PilA
MFEKKSTNNNSDAYGQPLSGGQTPQAQPPQNLPKEPEDILEGLDRSEAVVKGPARPVVKASVPPALTPPPKPITKEPFFKQHQKAFIGVIVVIILIAVLAVAGWYAYQVFVVRPNGQKVLNTNQTGQVNTNQNNAVNQGVVNQNINTNQTPQQPVDSDRDGLTDNEESMYGTDPNEVDTDKDGLTDRDEVKVFKTDPNNADTDGDTYTDGAEVRSGYDPKGPGRLLKIE